MPDMQLRSSLHSVAKTLRKSADTPRKSAYTLRKSAQTLHKPAVEIIHLTLLILLPAFLQGGVVALATGVVRGVPSSGRPFSRSGVGGGGRLVKHLKKSRKQNGSNP